MSEVCSPRLGTIGSGSLNRLTHHHQGSSSTHRQVAAACRQQRHPNAAARQQGQQASAPGQALLDALQDDQLVSIWVGQHAAPWVRKSRGGQHTVSLH